MARMRAPEPRDRPNFTEALDHLKRRRLKKDEWHGECFNLPDGDIVDLYEITKRNRQRDADAADAAVAAAVAAAAMRALSPGVVSD